MRILLTVSLLVLTPALAAASPAMQPGLYDIAMQMEMKGMPMQMPPMKFQQCLTAKDIDEGKAYDVRGQQGLQDHVIQAERQQGQL